ncbi:hypothetical protein HQN64_19260 [Enterobacteriaceae bacterium BIT-l23]|uniref:hypothetical protein n=1 Tax=Jejubacter sp. L23 TaxID=3092086 RepID=UPI001585100C|nr:hypothetical protein [Enterobacteriaceae bacterium BIT-l23]
MMFPRFLSDFSRHSLAFLPFQNTAFDKSKPLFYKSVKPMVALFAFLPAWLRGWQKQKGLIAEIAGTLAG